jgi:hypothetical protein
LERRRKAMSKEFVQHTITDPDFFFGGRSYFTVSDPQGERYTFRIQKLAEKKKKRKSDKDVFFASVMTGPDNTRSYSYMGVFEPDKCPQIKGSKIQRESLVRRTKNSKVSEDDLALKVMRWAIWVIMTEREIPEGYKIQHEGRCGKCGRRLTVPESIERGIGPVCYESMILWAKSIIEAGVKAGKPLASFLTNASKLVRELAKKKMVTQED